MQNTYTLFYKHDWSWRWSWRYACDDEGMHVMPGRVEVIMRAPEPQNIEKLHSFLQLCAESFHIRCSLLEFSFTFNFLGFSFDVCNMCVNSSIYNGMCLLSLECWPVTSVVSHFLYPTWAMRALSVSYSGTCKTISEWFRHSILWRPQNLIWSQYPLCVQLELYTYPKSSMLMNS